jgi:DNA mismatch repair protein MutS2
MDEKTLKALEYNKIINTLKDFPNSVLAKELVQKLKPSTDTGEIIRMQSETTRAVNMIVKKGNPPLGELPDIRGSLKRVEIGAILEPEELISIAYLLKISRNMREYYRSDKEEQCERCNELDIFFSNLKVHKGTEDRINDCIISEEEISDNASGELRNIRRKISNANEKIKSTLNNIIHSTKYQKYLQDFIVTIRGGRYVVPVKSEYRAEVKGIVHDTSTSGSTLFIEPVSVVELNNQLRQLEAEEKREIQKILSELTALVNENLQDLYYNLDIVVNLDFIFAKAKFSIELYGIQPKINTNGYINIRKARHPLLDDDKVVPIDIYLGDNFKSLVITGPNTGGKTVTLKTLGLLIIMVQSGLHIPAEEKTEVSVFNKIYADIGDEQSIEQNLSTFSSHMTNIVKILREADETSLVLLDELGAGTDPVEGAALAMSILEYLYAKGAFTAATTHYSELKMFALNTPGMENASCEFNVETLQPTYKLLIGIPGKSNAFAISKRLGLNTDIIQRATEFISQDKKKFEDVISRLEDDRKITSKEKDMAIQYKRETEELKKKLNEEKESFEDKKESIINEARREARRIIQQAKLETEDIIKELKKLEEIRDVSQKNNEIQDTRTRLNKNLNDIDALLFNQTEKSEEKISIPKSEIKPGRLVKVKSIDQKGTIISEPNQDNEVRVQVGIMKINVHMSDLKLIEEKNLDKFSGGTVRVNNLKSSYVKNELSVRGQVLDEALHNVDKFLDDAAMAGLKEVIIIHGKGAGILRGGIHDMLKNHQQVKGYRLGGYGEGEHGVTIVEMKH